MTDRFQLTVPADARYRILGPEVGARYAELAGGTAADGAALAASLSDALQRLADASPADAVIVLVFGVGADGLEVELRSGTRTEQVRQTMAQPR